MALALDRFSQRLAESGLLSDAEIASLIETLPANRRPHDGEQFARLLVKHNKLTVYQAQQIYAGKGRSLVLGNYIVLDKLGQGGMGTVLKAQHRRMERLVAIKVLSPAVVNRPGALQRFQREVKMAARLEHPNIVTAYDADEAAGVHFLVMQYVDGTDLARLVYEYGPLPLDQAVSCVLQAARGLDYAHRQGVIHRDVKPSNLLMDREGLVKVLDMGLARVDVTSDDHEPLTLSGQIMGTVDYMAPEQALDTRSADTRADIYSLGATLWFLLTARAIYQGESIMQKLRAHDCAPIPDLAEHCPGVTPELETIFRTMVAKRPRERYQTMGDVVTRLEHCLAGLPPSLRSLPGDRLHGPPSSQASLNLVPATGSKAGSQSSQPRGSRRFSTVYQPSQGDTDPDTRDTVTSPSVQTHGYMWDGTPWQHRGRNVYLALCGSFAVLLAVLVFYVPSKHGTIRVEIGDPQIQVAIKGTDIVFNQAGGEQAITLSPGEKTLVVKRGDFAFETDDFTLRKGETVAVRVQLLDGQVIVRQGDTLLGAERLPTITPPEDKPQTPEEPHAPRVPEAPQLAVAPFNALQAQEHQQAWAKHLGIAVNHTIELADGVELKLVLIPPGQFLMGSTDEQIEAAVAIAASDTPPANLLENLREEQTPQHRVRLMRSYFIGATEVTIGHYKAFTKATGHVTRAEHLRTMAERRPAQSGAPPLSHYRTFRAPGYPVTDDYPVAQVDWNDAQAFCRWLNTLSQTKLGEEKTLVFRLPTDAEWEFACRAGTQTLFSFGDKPQLLGKFGWNEGGTAQRVAALMPNAFGLYDMHGNVSEWCNDWYDAGWYGISPAVDPVGPAVGTARVMRGGNGIHRGAYRNLSAARQGYPPDWHSGQSAWGFRVAATIAPRSAAEPGTEEAQPAVDPKSLSTPDQQQAFIARVATLPAEQQVAAVAEKLMEVNPGFDGARTYQIVDDQVVEYGILTTNVTELWPLKALANLKKLQVQGGQPPNRVGRLESLAPLAGLRLEGLSCYNNPRLRDLKPLAGMPLASLNITMTGVADLKQLQGMQLQELNLFSTRVHDLSPLAGMPLTKLGCGYTRVSDLKPLQGMPLTDLICMKSQVADLSPLRGLKLRFLNLSDCANVTDCSPLQGMPLLSLVLNGTAVTDLSPLRGMPLVNFYCDDTAITDISPLAGMALQNLALKRTKVTDLSPIKDAPVTNLYFDVVPERDEALLRSMKQLRYINRMPTQQFWQTVKAGKTS